MSDSLKSFARALRDRIHRSRTDGFLPWPDAEFEDWARRLFRLQCTLNEPYGDWCRAQEGKGGTAQGWRSFPVVPTEAFKQFELSAVPAADRVNWFQSSGTTGTQASRHFHSRESLALYEASLLPWFRHHVPVGPGGPPDFLSLTPTRAECPHSSLVHMFHTVMARTGAEESRFAGRIGAGGSWDLDLTRLNLVIEHACATGRPLVVLGTAFNFVHWTDALAARGDRHSLPAGSVVMETGGYKGRSRVVARAELHQAIRFRLGLDARSVLSEYGMCELGSQAYDAVAHSPSWNTRRPSPRPFRFPPWCRASVVSPETGRAVEPGSPGLVRVFDLANAWSVAAVQTGDVGIARPEGFELVGRALDLEARGCSLMVA